MRKNYKLVDLDWANCAAKMEEAISKINGVTYANVNFITQKLTIEAADAEFDSCMEQARKICKKIEPDCKIV